MISMYPGKELELQLEETFVVMDQSGEDLEWVAVISKNVPDE